MLSLHTVTLLCSYCMAALFEHYIALLLVILYSTIWKYYLWSVLNLFFFFKVTFVWQVTKKVYTEHHIIK